MSGPGEVAGNVRTLARRITARLRLDAILRACAVATTGASAAIVALEIAARVTHFPYFRLLGAVALAAGLVAAAALYLRNRPRPGAWRARADAESGEPGVFSAAAAVSGDARFEPLLASRADSAAALLLAGPRPRAPLALCVRLAILSALAAAVAVNLPGLRKCNEDAAMQCTQPVLLDEVLALRDEPGAPRSGADAAVLDLAAERLSGRALSPAAADELARKLRDAVRANGSKTRLLAEALAKQPLFRDLAQALRHEDPAAVARAIEDLVQRAKTLDPRSREALESAGALLTLAAAEPDPLLKSALADAGRALSGDSGSTAAEGLRRLSAPLRRSLRFSESIQDVAVMLEGAATQDREGRDLIAIPAFRPRPGAAPPQDAGALPVIDDFRSLVRPGTSDETVLRRYFAIP